MKSSRCLLPCVLWAFVSVAVGQEASPASKEPVPGTPLMTSAPAGTQWTITYALKTSEKEPSTPEEVRARKMRARYSPQVLSKRVLKGGNGQLVIYTTYEADLKSETWVVGGYTYELPFRDGESIRANPKKGGDFPEIDWVSPANFRGTVTLKDRKVHLYETDPTGTPDHSAASSKPDSPKSDGEPAGGRHRQAYIDPETRLPVVVDSGNETMTYQFSIGPAEFPAMDPRINQLIKSGAE